MSQPTLLATLEALARQHLDYRGSLALDTPLVRELALDSLRLLTLVVEIENHFRIELGEADELGEAATAGDLIAMIERRLAAAGAAAGNDRATAETA